MLELRESNQVLPAIVGGEMRKNEFMYGVRKCSNFILLHVAVQFSQHHLLKRLSLPNCLFLPPLLKIGAHGCMDLFLGFLSCSVGLYFCFCASTPYCLDDCSFVV